jgi:hypothetical protein
LKTAAALLLHRRLFTPAKNAWFHFGNQETLDVFFIRPMYALGREPSKVIQSGLVPALSKKQPFDRCIFQHGS